jgi:DNA-binding NarL/FixJ family response regulator
VRGHTEGKEKETAPMPLTTVLIADFEKAGRATCRRILQPEKKIKVVGEARSGVEALTAAAKLKPRVLLLDLSEGEDEGVSLVSTILEKCPKTRIILLSERPSDADILDGLSQGALGYLTKPVSSTNLRKAVRAVAAGQAWVPRMMVGRLLDRLTHFPAQT